MTLLVPVILSGGSGTRLWPLSRRDRPKQFHRLVGDRTLLAATAERLAGMADSPLVVSNADHHDLVRAEVPNGRILDEPAGRNTAPAIAAAALQLPGDAVMVVLPSDHVISDVDQFRKTVVRAHQLAEEGWLVTFGVEPTRPATGYGYIHPGESLGPDAHRVDKFVEKPDAPAAAEYLESGFLWNSGMFVMGAEAYLRELQSHRPDIAEAVAAAVTDGYIEPLAWEDCPAESVDVAVMQETNRAAVVPLDAGWSDVGTWASLLDLGDRDADGNVVIGDVATVGVSGSYLRADGRWVAAAGVSGLIVVETPDAVLVVHRDQAESVKELVDRLPDELR